MYRIILLFTLVLVSKSQLNCALDEKNIYPIRFGGLLDDTEIVCFDHQKGNLGHKVVIGGRSKSKDIVTENFSSFVVMYTADNLRVDWGKEIYINQQSPVIVETIMNMDKNCVYVGMTMPIILFKLNFLDGSIMEKKISAYSPSELFYSNLLTLHHLQEHGLLLYYTFNTQGDSEYLNFVNDTDLLANDASYLMLNGEQNDQSGAVLVVRKCDQCPNSTTYYIELIAKRNTNTTQKLWLQRLNFDSNRATPLESQFYDIDVTNRALHNYSIAAMDFRIDQNYKVTRFGCLVSDFQDIQKQVKSISLFYQQNDTGFANNISYYLMDSEVNQISQITCRNAIITADLRFFIFLDYVISNDPNQMKILEISNFIYYMQTANQPTYYLSNSIKHLKLFQYRETSLMKSKYKIYDNWLNTGKYVIFGIVSATSLDSDQNTSMLKGYLIKSEIGTNNLNCLDNQLIQTNGPVNTSEPFSIVWNPITTSTMSAANYLNDVSNSYIIKDKNVLQHYLFKSGCQSLPPQSIPKFKPLIVGPLYYIIGIDTGKKEFDIIENFQMINLNACQNQSISYNLRDKNKAQVPYFMGINRSTLKILVDSPTTNDKGIYDLEIVIRDIYDTEVASDFQVIVENQDSSPILCFNETGVLGKPFVQDILYIIGTKKQMKIEFRFPQTSLGETCENLYVIQAQSFVDAVIGYTQLPTFMKLDSQNRNFQIYLSKNQTQYIKQKYEIRIRIFIKGSKYQSQYNSFQVYITDTQKLGCFYSNDLKPPMIKDQLVYATSQFPVIIPFNKFELYDDKCELLLIHNKTMSDGISSVPDCIIFDFLKSNMTVIPSLCTQKVYEMRLEAWIYDPQLEIKVLYARTKEFKIILSTMNDCVGNFFLQINYQSYHQVSKYVNIDHFIQQNDQYQPALNLNNNIINSIPDQPYCDSKQLLKSTKLLYDNGFKHPTYMQVWITDTLSYYIPTSSMTEQNLGVYDLRMQIGYLDGNLIYPNVLTATVFLDYHLYKESSCVITKGSNQTNYVDYYIKRVAQTLVLSFEPFQIVTEGCIYDKILYNFQILSSNTLPIFISQNKSSLNITIKTNKIDYAGLYDVQLVGQLNPFLELKHDFQIDMIEFIYPNRDAPGFKRAIPTPIEVGLRNVKNIQLPKITDVDEDPFKMQFYDFTKGFFDENLPLFFKYDRSKHEIVLSPTDEDQIGKHKIVALLSDQHKHYPKQRLVPIDIIVLRYDQNKIKELRNFHERKIQTIPFIGFKIEKMTKDSILQLTFNVSIFNQTVKNEQFNKKSLKIEVKKAYTEEIQDVNWFLLNKTSNQLFIKLNFSDFKQISQFQDKDQLLINVIKGENFFNLEEIKIDQNATLQQIAINELKLNFEYKLGDLQTEKVNIPKQEDQQFDGKIGQNGKTALSSSVNSILFGNLIVNIIMFPQNALFFFQIIAKISTFNIIPVDQFVNQHFIFEEQIPINDNFAAMGYESCNLLQNLDIVLLFLIGIFVLSILSIFGNVIIPENSNLRPYFDKLYNAVFFSMTIRILLESQIELTLSSIMNFTNLNYEYLGDQVSLILTFIIGVMMFATPICILLFIIFKKDQFNDPVFKTKFGSLYEGLKTQNRVQLLCNFYFTLRRLILIAVTVHLTNYPGIQIIVYIVMSEINIIYLLTVKPYEDPFSNKLEIFNEACVLALSYQLFTFTDFVEDVQIKEQAGWGLIVAILLNFGVNILIQLIFFLKTLPPFCRKIKNFRFCKKRAQIYKQRKAPQVSEPKIQFEKVSQQSQSFTKPGTMSINSTFMEDYNTSFHTKRPKLSMLAIQIKEGQQSFFNNRADYIPTYAEKQSSFFTIENKNPIFKNNPVTLSTQNQGNAKHKNPIQSFKNMIKQYPIENYIKSNAHQQQAKISNEKPKLSEIKERKEDEKLAFDDDHISYKF